MAKKRTKARPKAGAPPRSGLQVQTGDDPTIYIYDEIGPAWAGMIDAPDIVAALEEIGDVGEIDVRINSPGGLAWNGATIYNLLVDHPATINVRIDGIAASIASIIAMAGDTITVSENSLIMIHNAWSFAMGDKYELAKALKMLEQTDKSMVNTYVSRTGNEADKITEWMDAESWFTADEAIDAGFADAKAAAVKNCKMRVPKDRYKHPPADLEQYEFKVPGLILSQPPAPKPNPKDRPTRSPAPAAGSGGYDRTIPRRIAAMRRRA